MAIRFYLIVSLNHTNSLGTLIAIMVKTTYNKIMYDLAVNNM